MGLTATCLIQYYFILNFQNSAVFYIYISYDTYYQRDLHKKEN